MKWYPISDILNLQDRMNRFFQNTFQGEDSGMGTWVPAIDIYETETEFVVTAEVPGVAEESISVDIKNNSLTIKGEKQSPIDKDNENYYRLERTFGKFTRTFSLPNGLNTDNTKASIKDGILTIVLGKTDSQNIKTVTITKE